MHFVIRSGIDMSDERPVFLSVVWEKSRSFEPAIRAEIAKDFRILAETDVFWPRKVFTKKLAEFYGWDDWFCWWNKARKCGRGVFKVIVFEDPSPEWGRSLNAYGREMMMDLRVHRMKRICRRLTGHGNRFHSSINAEETDLESMALFGKPIADWLEERARWRMPSADDLERLFASGNLERIGDGSRRVCYRIPGTGLCVKSYRSEAELDTRMRADGALESHQLKLSVLREIRRYRYSGDANTSCREWRYLQELKYRLPPHLLKVFPEVLERILVPSRGWCLIENEIVNADGTPPLRFCDAYFKADSESRVGLIARFCYFVSGLVDYAVRFYDPQNMLVQKDEKGGFRLRIVDFEPDSRTLIPLNLFPNLVKRKVVRRMKRYLSGQLGVSSAMAAKACADAAK